MRITSRNGGCEGGSVIAYFLLALVIIGSIAGLYAYSIHNLSLAQRR